MLLGETTGLVCLMQNKATGFGNIKSYNHMKISYCAIGCSLAKLCIIGDSGSTLMACILVKDLTCVIRWDVEMHADCTLRVTHVLNSVKAH